MKLLNHIISLIKGERFELDDSIPFTYIFRFFVSKVISLIWGIIRFHQLKLCFVHPTTIIKCESQFKFGKNLSIGRDCYIDALSERGFECGDNCSIGCHTHISLTGSLKFLGKGLKLGNNVGLGTHGYYGSGMGFCEIGDDTIIGNFVSVHPENHNYEKIDVPIRMQGVNGKGIKIGNNCWIGSKVTILDGTIVGNGCIIAAGAVVKGVFPDNVIIGGIPAKIIKKRI